MTYGEIIDVVKAYSRNIQNALKERAIMDYKLADLIATNIASSFNKECKSPSLVEAYEFLFQKEKKEQDKVKAKNEMEIWKQKMMGFADNNNRKWGEKNK